MATLNLANKQGSDIDYEIVNFSDTQKLLKFKTNVHESQESTVKIVSRFQWSDLQILIQACSILKDAGHKIILQLPYMLGARSDRNFDYEHEAHYMREVIAPIINGLGATRVFSIDPHSTVVEGCIKAFKPLSITNTLVSKAVLNVPKGRHFCIVPPDVGAEKRGLEAAKSITPDVEHKFEGIIQCTKHREISTGKILGVEVLGHPGGLDCIIVDDLCDGGRTFIEVSKALKAKGAENVYLCVAHGLFSYGFDTLIPHIEKVYTTNSYQSEESMINIWKNESQGYGEGFHQFVSVTDVCV